MAIVPTLTYHLPSRRAGSFGASRVGRLAEWFTTTWARFGIFLSWLLAFAIISIAPAPIEERLLMIAVSPIFAVVFYVLTVLTGWVLYFVPWINVGLGFGRIAYIWVFCRLIVQPAPHIDMPVWFGNRHR